MPKPKQSVARIRPIKPKNVLLKPVNLNFGFFQSLVFGIKNVAIHDWAKVVSIAVEAASTLNLAKKPEELAYNLLQRSITKALFELVGEDNLHNLSALSKSNRSIPEKVEITIRTEDVLIDRHFFDRPKSLAILPILQAELKTWLINYGLAEKSADNISTRLPNFFQKALIEEWRHNSIKYKPLLEALNSPFAQADELELGWRCYNAYLQQQIDQSIFDEPFSLAQIYIPLNAYYLETEDSNSRRCAKEMGETKRYKVVIDLKKELLDWVLSEKKSENTLHLRVISGGPGSGKSSFARIFAAEISQTERVRVLFVPLHLIDASKGLTEEISR